MMPGRNHSNRDDVRAHKSRDKDYSHRGDLASPRDLDTRGSAGDRRVKQSRQRDPTTASDMETPAHRGHYHEGPSRT